MWNTIKIKDYELGLHYKEGLFVGVKTPGSHRISWGSDERIDVIDRRVAYQPREDDVTLHSSGKLGDYAYSWRNTHKFADIVLIDGEFLRVHREGTMILWRGFQTCQYRELSFLVPFSSVDYLQNARDAGCFAADGELSKDGELIDLADNQRALVWVEGRFHSILGPGLHALWTKRMKIRFESVEAGSARFQHKELNTITESASASNFLSAHTISEGEAGVVLFEGKYQETLEPGVHVYWKNTGGRAVKSISMKEQAIDIAGQEIMTADKVSLRMNAVMTVVVSDPLKTIRVSEDAKQSLYREAQLALRSAVGTRELDTLLSDKQSLADELMKDLAGLATSFGYTLKSFGIRDLILPGEMKDLLNRVTEAKKASEAALITRREETAAARMQANTAKILSSNPELMRLRELEALTQIAEKTQLTVVLGEGGLVEKLTKML